MVKNGGVTMDEETKWERIKKRIKMFFKFFSGYVKVEMNPRTERENQLIRRRIFWIIFLIIVASLATYGIVVLIYGIQRIPDSELSCYEKYLTIISLLGVILTAIVTIFTTFFIVHQSKRIDYHKERLSVMPFLEISIDISLADHDTLDVLRKCNELKINCANKGNGLALHVSEDSDSYDTFEENITVGSSTELDVYYDSFPERITLRFMDIFENVYLQKFDVRYNDDFSKAYVTCFPPYLIKRTSRFRYVQ